MGIVQLGYVGFGVSDVPAWETFAQNVLGLQVSERGEDGTLYLRMDEYHHRIALHPSGEDDLVYAGWMTRGPYELRELEARLRDGGVEVTEGTAEETANRKVRRMVWFRDPSGYRYELFFGPRLLPGKPFLPARPMSGFKAGPLGLGHIVLRVDSKAETERFYTQLMGLRLTDYGSGRPAFFHCNRRHHSVAVAEVPGGPDAKRLVHLMLEVQTLDDVGTCYDLCERGGAPLLKTLGKHPNDHMISFYVRTPSGFELELGFGAREVDDATWVVESYEPGDVWGHRPIGGDSRGAVSRTAESAPAGSAAARELASSARPAGA